MKEIIKQLADRNIICFGKVFKSLTEQNIVIGYNFRYTSHIRASSNIFTANAALMISDIEGEVVEHEHHFSIMLQNPINISSC